MAMNGFDIRFDQSPSVVFHSFCCRCQMPTEMSPVGSGRVPSGPKGQLEDVRHIVLCLDCKEMMVDCPKDFWWTGWSGQEKE